MKILMFGLVTLLAGLGLGVTLEAYVGLVRPLEQTVTIETFPGNLQVELSDGQICHTPCKIYQHTALPLTVKVTDVARKELMEKMKNVVPRW